MDDLMLRDWAEHGHLPLKSEGAASTQYSVHHIYLKSNIMSPEDSFGHPHAWCDYSSSWCRAFSW